ncbi:MAG: hypothetical protein KDD62_10110, partial [Bdellovibrionales bacterium]|nr:hypothetical protein [Bdellovibrionales bacterium]
MSRSVTLTGKLLMACYYVVVIIAILASMEYGLAYLYNHPPEQQWIRRGIQDYFVNWERTQIQRTEACSMYDPAFTYRLRPGVCQFKEREFDTTISINSAGYRS